MLDSALLDTAVVHGIFWVIGVAASIWILGPAVMYALGRRRFAIEVSEDASAAEPRGDDPDYERYFQQLYALGYRPIGRTVETARYFTPLHWRWRSLGSRVVVSQDRKTFVSFYRVVANQPLRFAATTIFEGGGALSTAYTAGKLNPSPRGNYKYFELLKADPPQLLADHQENVALFCEQRGLVARRVTLREVSDEGVELTRRIMPRSVGLGMYAIVAAFVMTALPALKLVTRRPDFAPWWMHPAVGLCVAALIYAALRWAILPSRVPMLLRMAPMLLVMLLPMSVISVMEPRRETARQIHDAVSQLEVDADKGAPVEPGIDRIAAFGGKACREVLKRMDKPATTPARRQALHRTLVRLNGSDLGDATSAWMPWCRDAYRRR